ncbi:MAG: glucosamine-6-phosphate isomerase [Candidatus Hydrogenedentes bacterium]|nr:glucosamine-6-phosphate isomerase [Candidatus Hydrogenedentota bacterium]
MNLMSTLKGSMLEHFFPEGWDLAKLDKLCGRKPADITKRESWWHKKFLPVPCDSLADFDMMMGHEIAFEITQAKKAGHPLVFILPVGPMGMYRWAVYFLTEWKVDCKHVHGFNMDEWSDAVGNTLPGNDPGAFQNAMEGAFYGPLGKLTVPKGQRHYATKKALPRFGEQIRALKAEGGRLVTVFGVGRVCHIAFWEPHFAKEYASINEWKQAEFRLGAQLHPLTIEQNAITSFKSRTTLVPTRANTVGPGLFLKSDKIIGGCDGALGRGMMWQGMSLWATLHHEPTPWLASTFMPTLAGKLFFLKELAGPLEPECN